MTPHATNTRALLRPVAEKYADQEPLFGIEQEYTFFKDGRPLGFPPNGFPAPQAFYYCGVGADEVFGRDVVEAHLDACLDAGLGISGINAEVMPGQWEFQVGPLEPARRRPTSCGWPAGCSTASPRTSASSATLDPKPVKGDWNGAGAHTNFSTKAMREGYDPIIAACEALGKKAEEHVAGYGADIEHRLTGSHETAPWSEFSYGVSEPRRLGAHPVAGRDRQEGLHRGPASERQHGPVRGDPADHRHGAAARWRERDASSRTRQRPGRGHGSAWHVAAGPFDRSPTREGG